MPRRNINTQKPNAKRDQIAAEENRQREIEALASSLRMAWKHGNKR